MPTFRITAPDGTTYDVTGPEGSTEQEALAQVQAQHQSPAEAPGDDQAEPFPSGGPEAVDSLANKATRFVRGGVALGGKVGNYVKQGAFNTAAGAGQLVSAGADLVSPGTLDRYNQSVEGINADREQAFEQDYGSEPSKLADAAATVGVGAALGPTSRAATALKTIVNGAKAGAVSGAASYQEGATGKDKLLWTLGGGLLGAMVSSVPSAYTGIKNTVRRYFTDDALPDAAAKAAQVQQVIPGLEGQLTMGQQSGKYTTIQTEARLAKEAAQKQWISQAQIVKDHLEETAAKYGPILDPETAVRRGQMAMRNTSKAMRSTRKDLWDADLAAIRTKVESDAFSEPGMQGASQTLVELPGLKDSVTAIADDFGGTLSPNIQKAITELDTFDGHLSFDTMEELLQKVNGNNFNVLSGVANGDANRAAAGQIKTAIMDSLDSVDTNTEIGAMLREMRDGYAARSTAIKEFEGTAAAKILGVKRGTVISNPEAALQSVYKLSPTNAGKLSQVLENRDPELLGALRGANLRDALTKSTSASAKPGSPSFDVKRFIDTTVKDGRLRAGGLYTPADEKLLTQNTEALGALLNAAPFRAAIAEPEQVGMSVASRSIAFITRNLFRTLGQGPLEKVMFDPKARNAFLNASKLVNSGKADQATMGLTRFLSQYMESDESASPEGPAN